jgi:hypothetical protein
MACFWKNERNAVEVCLREVGNYVYVGYDDPDPEYSLVEVARDLSGYVKTDFFGPTAFGNSLYSKRRQIYQLRYNTTPNPDTVTLWRDDGETNFTEVAGVPTGLASFAKEIIYTSGKLRGVNWDGSFNVSFYASEDGEAWSLVPGSVSVSDSIAGAPGAYTVLGSRLISARRGVGSSVNPTIFYSDDGGATWTGGTGTNTSGSNSGVYPFVHTGSNIIALQAGNIYVSADGAAWTRYTGLFVSFFAEGPKIAASGTGLVVAAGTVQSSGFPGFAYSANHGTSWALRDQPTAGIPDFSEVYALFWDAVDEQFVVFVVRGDTGTSQIYTSPTGQTWTAGIVIPDLVRSPTQVID